MSDSIWRELKKFGIQPVEPSYYGDPVGRIVNTILSFAVQDNADQVVVETHHLPSKGHIIGVQVLYRIDGQWREQMKMSGYVWAPLAQNVRERFRDQSTFKADTQFQSFLDDVMQSDSDKDEANARAVKISTDSGDKITLVLN